MGLPGAIFLALFLSLSGPGPASASPWSDLFRPFTYRCPGFEAWGGEHTYVIPRGDFCSGKLVYLTYYFFVKMPFSLSILYDYILNF